MIHLLWECENVQVLLEALDNWTLKNGNFPLLLKAALIQVSDYRLLGASGDPLTNMVVIDNSCFLLFDF
jgi:hypothetical protein